jgi:ubiquinone/menaquinone biosynthesis C-methylase UbiE
MKFNYKETNDDLQTRIDIHTRYGQRNIDDWMLDVLPLKKGMRILDIGCGSGKQCFLYYDHLDTECEVFGGDVSEELLMQGQLTAAEREANISFQTLNFNEPFPFADNEFDLVTCCFAIYYAEDMPFTFKEINRVLKPGGTFFTTGPLPANKQMFYEIITEATGKVIPPMPGSSRFDSEIFDTAKDIFSKAEMLTFENPLVFEDSTQPFLDYTRASISEDRKLWNTLFDDNDTFEQVMEKITDVANQWHERDGKLVMTKVVGGIMATK